jgi:colicin import membrane protein
MTDERSHPSYASSLLLHGGVVALILLFTYVLNQESPTPPKIFELVAGEGDNYAATAAPALGVVGGIKVSIPRAPTPVEPEPATLQEAPEPVVAKVTPAKPMPVKSTQVKKLPDFAHAVERTASRVANRIEAKYKKQLEAEERKQMTQEQYLKEHPLKAGPDAEGIRQGVVGGSIANKTGGAGGKALTREEGHELDAYWSMLRSKLSDNLEKPTDASDDLKAVVEFYVAANGSISGIRIIHSSGNEEFDRAVLEAVHRTHSIGPRPDGRGDIVDVPFKMHEDDAAP